MTAYLEGKWFTKLYTCNYGPAGNYIGGQMYEQGQACSKCPKGTSCSRDYPGLCGKEFFDYEIIKMCLKSFYDFSVRLIWI